MIQSLWTGVSGLSAQQTALDNESNNIANVNTVGYKASRISFADQIYQDSIGKGTKVLDAEKLYTQGSIQITGVDYDMALEGDGFFSVVDPNASGTSEVYYTRAGNFRMGDNGVLTDASGNEVQGWAMSTITDEDITSTNQNIDVFTSDYTQLVSSKVISHSNYVETITAKTTDYAETAEADSTIIYTGSGAKTQSSKISDVEALVANYTAALESYQNDPEGVSSTSTAQVSQIQFDGSELQNEGDQIYVYIDGNKITQDYVSVVATTDADGDGIGPNSSSAEQLEDNVAASKIATYKALADQISQISGLVAYTVKDSVSDGTQGIFEADDIFTKTTAEPDGNDMEALLGMIQIESLIPGEAFSITEVAEVSNNQTTQGTINITSSATTAVQGSGYGALQSAKDALSQAVTGSQRDVFTLDDLTLDSSPDGDDLSFEFVIYDKVLEQNVTVGPIVINNADSIDKIVEDLQDGGTTPIGTSATLFNSYFTVENINGNLVISTNEDNYDVEFATTLTGLNKGIESTPSSNGANELVTFDQDLEPTPDGEKTYEFDITYGITVPETATATDETRTLDTSAVDYTNAFEFEFTFDDVDDSMGRGGGNQTISISIPAGTATDEASLAAAIELELDAISAGEFTVSGAVTDAITITNTDGEEISSISMSEQINVPIPAATPTPNDMSELVDDINATLSPDHGTATLNTDGELVITLDGTNGGDNGFTVLLKENNSDTIIERNADFSGNEGAGAEFIEIITTIDQNASQSSLQLTLDALGISDSAFGEFSVDSSGLITMSQGGAEFAIGQVSIALFNNYTGLEAEGNNLMSETTSSGDAIYSINNTDTASIQGQALELSTADLSESLVNLMIYQRAFEANAKTITTADSILSTLIDLKR